MEKTIKILICDSQPIVRFGLQCLVSETPAMMVIGQAQDGEEVVAMARTLKPDVIVMDLALSRKNGVDAIREIKKENPEVRVLVFTDFSDEKHVFPALKAGASGYLLKDYSTGDLLQAVNDVYEGKSSLHPVIARKVIQELHHPSVLAPAEESLSEREIEVLKCVARGMSNHEIARTLRIKEGTVRIHVGHILDKLKLTNRTQAALYALRKGHAQLDER